MTDRPRPSPQASDAPASASPHDRPSPVGEASFRATFEQAAIGRVLTRLDGRLERVNRAFAEMLGYTVEELETRAFVDVTHPDDRVGSLELAEQLMGPDAPAQQFEKRYLHRDGHVVWANINATVIRDAQGRPLYFMTDVVDITARKRAEEALRREKERAQTYLDLAGVMMLALDVRGHVTLVNRRACELLGYAPGELCGKDWFATCVPPARAAEVRTVFRKLMARQLEPVEHFENTVVSKDGTERLIAWHNALLTDEAGRIVGSLSSGEDITEQRRIDRALRESEARARAMYAELPVPTFVWQRVGAEFLLLDLNVAALRTTEGATADWRGRRIADLHADAPEVVADVARCYAERSSFQRELVRGGSPSSAARTLVLTYGFVPPDMILVHTEDVTDRRRTAEQLQVSQRLEAVGLLAGGVAHDFNNLLTAIDGFASCTLDALHPSDPLRENQLEIRGAAKRAAGLTRQLLAFSRRQVLEPRVLLLNDVVANLEGMLRRLLGEHIEFEVRLGAELGRVRADLGQIEQVIVNLAVNARDAMPHGGKLLICTENVTLEETPIAADADALRPGPHVLVTVSDTGCGMSAETTRRIFEPFFTTKEVGRGTGLGLSTVYGIVRQSGGSISVYSELGLGTTFRIALPRVDAAATDEPRAEAPTTARGHESVLVVEDDEAVRRLSARILGTAGYQVATASSGEEAIRACALPDAQYDLVLTDLVMPKMSGRELADRILRSQPATKVLYTSGYPDGTVVNHGDLQPGTHFIGKPFSANELRRKVREVLDSGPRSAPAETPRDGPPPVR